MRNLSIAGKLYWAFAIVILLTIITGGISIYRLVDVSNTFVEVQTQYFKIADDAMEANIALLTARRYEKDFIELKDKKYIDRMESALQKIHKLAENITSVSSRLGLMDIAAFGPKVLTAKEEYKAAFGSVSRLIAERGSKSEGIEGELRKYAHQTEGAIKKLSADKLMIDYLTLRRHEKDLLLRSDMKYVKSAQDVLKKMETNALENFTGPESEMVLEGAKNYLKIFEKLADNIAGVLKEYPVMSKAAHDIEDLLRKLKEDVMTIVKTKQAEVISEKKSTILFLYIICGIITLSGIFLSFFSVRSITKPLNRIIEGLNEGAKQLTSAAGQVSSSSQSLAEGSSEQASSIEETSASMEEMSSMTAKNADNAFHANNLMKDTSNVVVTANSSMDELTQSMEDISKASDETSKIIKTIDEIAFQTNLLALNAAVEAARAGEAGAGFAVVADEVRNLAMRAADAAKDTARLIEGTVKKVNSGSELLASANEAFSNVSESTDKAGNLVFEISEASREQSNGIEQVNIAITEMDKIVQQNAANAEESASASEELNAQAEQLKEYVEDLAGLVTGKKSQSSTMQNPIKTENVQPGHSPLENKKVLKRSSKEIRPDQVILFDDDEEFKGF